MMTKQKKIESVSGLVDQFKRSKAAFLIDFTGMNVDQVTNLRKILNPVESEMKVVKNTLAKLALKQSPEYESVLSKDFVGVNAIVFSYGEVSASAKVLTQFSKEVDSLKIKMGAMEGERLDAAQIKFLATLPGKDELRSQLLSTFQAPMAKLVRTMNEVPSGFVRVLAAQKDKKSA